MEINKIDVSSIKIDATRARSIGLLITLDRFFFDNHRLRNTGFVQHDDIVFRVGREEKSFSYDEFIKLIGIVPP